jgi:transposase
VTFRTYVEEVLPLTLRPGDIVAIENIGSHKSTTMPAHSLSRCLLPKYSPELNPIEQVFAKLSHLLREVAARTVENACIAIGQLLDNFILEECASYFKNSGCAST